MAVEPKAKKTKRGGKHLKAAIKIDTALDNGSFDLPAYMQWATDQTYATPVNVTRNKFAKSIVDGAEDAVEASLYSAEGFSYVIWNRKVACVAPLRADIFATFAAENDDAEDDGE